MKYVYINIYEDTRFPFGYAYHDAALVNIDKSRKYLRTDRYRVKEGNILQYDPEFVDPQTIEECMRHELWDELDWRLGCDTGNEKNFFVRFPKFGTFILGSTALEACQLALKAKFDGMQTD